MLIAHITDSHIEIPEIGEAGRLADFDRVVDHIKQLDTAPDLVIHTGDISHWDRLEEYQFAKTVMARIGLPCEVIPGNKDSREGMAAVFDTALPYAQKSIETEHWNILLLDSLSASSNMGDYCEERLAWLESQLIKARKPIVIFMHHPSFIMADNPYPFQFVEQKTADRFNNLVGGFDGIKHIFCGHAHRNTKGAVGNIAAMTLTAMSLDRRKGEYGEAFDGKPIYQLIELKDDGSIQTKLQACG